MVEGEKVIEGRFTDQSKKGSDRHRRCLFIIEQVYYFTRL